MRICLNSEDPTTADLLEQRGSYYRLYQSQFRGKEDAPSELAMVKGEEA